MNKRDALPAGKPTEAYTRSTKQITDDVATQHARFVEAARALGCDEDEAAFDEKLKAIARKKGAGTPENAPPPKRKN